MSDQGHLDEAKLLALANAKLDAQLKETDLIQKKQPWRTLAVPTTLMALVTGFVSIQSGIVSYYQEARNERQATQLALLQRAADEARDSRELVWKAATESKSIGCAFRNLRMLAAAGLINQASYNRFVKNMGAPVPPCDSSAPKVQ